MKLYPFWKPTEPYTLCQKVIDLCGVFPSWGCVEGDGFGDCSILTKVSDCIVEIEKMKCKRKEASRFKNEAQCAGCVLKQRGRRENTKHSSILFSSR